MNDADKISIRDSSEGAIISVKAVPGSSRDKIVGVLGECLKVATSCAAEKGRANQAIAAILAKALGTDRRSVELVSGQTSPRKEFCITGFDAARVRKILGQL